MDNSRQLHEDAWLDQEAFVLNIHGAHLKLTVARFTKEYLCAVNSAVMPTNQALWVRRSRHFDLKLLDQRAQALKLCIGLVTYLYSGKAEVGILQKLFE
jgi:hypothetical protein